MEEKLYEIIAEVLEIEKDRVTADLMMEDTEEWDSIAHIRIVAEIEESLVAEIPFDKIADIKSVQDFLDIIK